MFDGCVQLLYLNLLSFKKEGQNIYTYSVFDSSIIKAKICIEDLDSQEYFF